MAFLITTWRVLSETKAIMPPSPMSLDGNNCFITETWNHKLKLLQEVMDIPFAATWERWLNCKNGCQRELGKGPKSYNIKPWTMTLTLNWPLVKHTHCTLTHHNWHLCRVISKSHQGFKRYRADMIVCLTLNYHLDFEVTLVKYALCTSSHTTLHLRQVISKCRQPFNSYRADA